MWLQELTLLVKYYYLYAKNRDLCLNNLYLRRKHKIPENIDDEGTIEIKQWQRIDNCYAIVIKNTNTNHDSNHFFAWLHTSYNGGVCATIVPQNCTNQWIFLWIGK